jgi:hypothetical protein
MSTVRKVEHLRVARSVCVSLFCYILNQRTKKLLSLGSETHDKIKYEITLQVSRGQARADLGRIQSNFSRKPCPAGPGRAVGASP